MKNKYIQHFEEMLFNELSKSNLNNKIKKETLKSFKKNNPNIYKEKRDDFFDEVHPY